MAMTRDSSTAFELTGGARKTVRKAKDASADELRAGAGGKKSEREAAKAGELKACNIFLPPETHAKLLLEVARRKAEGEKPTISTVISEALAKHWEC